MDHKAKRHALVSLLLLVPAPSIGVLFGMILMPGTVVGQGLFLFSKIWILLFPASWFFLVERERFPRAKTEPGGFRMGLITGLIISVFIIAMFMMLGRRLIDIDVVHGMAATIGLSCKSLYLTGAAYWIGINSVLEEYVWRWFVVRQCAKLMRPKWAITVSALCFTLHHILALQVFLSWPVTIAAGMAIAFGGALWSWMFLRYNTIWPSWLSHALVDTAVFGIGYVLIFG